MKNLNKEEIQELFESWNWNDGKIENLPNLDYSLSQYIGLYYNNGTLVLNKVSDENLMLSIQLKVMTAFENIANHFKTNQSKVNLYNHDYLLNDNCNQFFWENNKKEVFYIRPDLMRSIFFDAINNIENRLFTDSIPIKEMSAEESNKYFDLLEVDEEKANEFRSSYFTSLSKNSTKKELELCSELIIQSISGAFEFKVNKSNYNGNHQLKDEIVAYINSSEELMKIVDLNE